MFQGIDTTCSDVSPKKKKKKKEKLKTVDDDQDPKKKPDKRRITEDKGVETKKPTIRFKDTVVREKKYRKRSRRSDFGEIERAMDELNKEIISKREIFEKCKIEPPNVILRRCRGKCGRMCMGRSNPGGCLEDPCGCGMKKKPEEAKKKASICRMDKKKSVDQIWVKDSSSRRQIREQIDERLDALSLVYGRNKSPQECSRSRSLDAYSRLTISKEKVAWTEGAKSPCQTRYKSVDRSRTYTKLDCSSSPKKKPGETTRRKSPGDRIKSAEMSKSNSSSRLEKCAETCRGSRRGKSACGRSESAKKSKENLGSTKEAESSRQPRNKKGVENPCWTERDKSPRRRRKSRVRSRQAREYLGWTNDVEFLSRRSSSSSVEDRRKRGGGGDEDTLVIQSFTDDLEFSSLEV